MNRLITKTLIKLIKVTFYQEKRFSHVSYTTDLPFNYRLFFIFQEPTLENILFLQNNICLNGNVMFALLTYEIV